MQLIEYFQKVLVEKNCKKLFFSIAALILIIMTYSSSQYGICWDELLMTEYGDNILKFYTSFGKNNSYYQPERTYVMHLYGPFFDLLGAVANINNTGDIYERRHLLIAIFGFLGILFTGLTAKEIANWKLGILAMLFIFLTPVYFGHSMFNSKDIPFAAAYIASIYYMIRFIKEYPAFSWSTSAGLIVSIGIAISIRIGGVLLFFYFTIFFVNKLLRSESGTRLALLKNKKSIFILLLTLAGSYLFAMLFWPYALISPIMHPLEALTLFSKVQFDSMSLFNGFRPHFGELPWNYIPTWIYVTTPLFICASLILAPIIVYKWKKFNEVIKGDIFLILLFTGVFPVAYIVFNESNVFDGWRHVTFIYPSLVVCCAAIWYGVISVFKNRTPYLKYIIVSILAVFMIEPALFMVRNHKFETFYFSPVTGGVKGAFNKFDIDYYGTSLRYAVEWIAEHADSLEKSPDNKINIRCFYGESISVEHFIKKYDNLAYVKLDEASPDWDYSIVQPVQAKHDTSLLTNWPPKGMVHQIEIDGAPIVAIVKNANRNNNSFSIYTNNDINALINASLTFYQSGDFLNCIAACERTLILDPGNLIALNNSGASFNNLRLFDEGIEYCRKAIEKQPDFELAKGNLNIAVEGKKKAGKTLSEGVANNYINLSLIYFNLQNFNMCIAKCNKVILVQPNNAAAFNNICASYNGLKEYDNAILAGEKALAINPDFELAKNNVNFAKASSGK